MRFLCFRHICAVILLTALTGCAGYKLGAPGGQAAGVRSIEIAPFANKTTEPRLADSLMVSLRTSVQRDGTYHLDTHDDGDIILTGVITDYQRHELSVQPNDVLSMLDYELTLTAKVTARERSTGKILFERPVTGKTPMRAGTDFTSAERQAIPLLTDDLARKTTSLLVDGTW